MKWSLRMVSLFSLSLIRCALVNTVAGDSSGIKDSCPTAMLGHQTFFINGFACKKPCTITASDFQSSKLNEAGDTDNYLRSSVRIITAADFPGLNTQGLSIARTDLAVDGRVLPHSHPRASEMFFVSKGVVVAGFVDTSKKLFQKTLREGDVFVFPRGLLHFSLNAGYELATIFSVLNGQNPGVVSIADAVFDSDGVDKQVRSWFCHKGMLDSQCGSPSPTPFIYSPQSICSDCISDTFC